MVDPRGRKHYRKSNIKVIVVGAGFAGLSCAIECFRKGHDVEVFEQAPEFAMLGDLIAITPNAARVVSNWGNVLSEVQKKCTWADHMSIHDANGRLIQKQPMILENNGYPFCNTHRGYFQGSFYEYAKSLGIKITMGVRITQYDENENEASILVNGKRHVADAIIGADGVHSRARHFVTGRDDKPVSSGFAIYRAWLPLSALDDKPVLKEIRNGGDSMNAWIGEDKHSFVTVCEALQCVGLVLTHKDDYAVKESWSSLGKVEDVLEVVEGWDPRLRAIVSSIPKNKLIDWKLLWRDPVKQWVSKGGRIALCGDSAHPFLPSSGNGASQAIEDSTTIASLLELAGKGDIPLALRAFEALRYERVSLSQRNGFETRHRWHKTDWKEFKKDPNTINLPQPDWLYGHDAEKYTYERWDDVVSHVKYGLPLKSTNTYPGYVHEDWTVKGVMEMEKQTAAPLRVRAKL